MREIGFEVREITYRDLLKNAIKNSILHFPSLLDAEIKTGFYAIRSFMRRGRTSVPSVSREEYKLIYASKVK